MPWKDVGECLAHRPFEFGKIRKEIKTKHNHSAENLVSFKKNYAAFIFAVLSVINQTTCLP